MFNTNSVNFIDISVYNRNIKSIQEEIDFTPHSLGYLDFLDKNIHTTIVRFGDSSEAFDRYKLYRYHLNDSLRLFRFLHSQKPAIVLFHGFSFPFRFLFLKFLLGKNFKWIIQHHAGNPSKNKLKSLIQRIAYSQADGYLFVTQEQASAFIENKIIPSKDSVFEIMECSTSFELFDKKTARAKLGITTEKKIFIWVGNLDENKDPMCLLRAFQFYKNQGNIFELYLFYNKTDLLSEMETFITQNHLESFVFLKGKIKNAQLEYWFNASDFFVSCSHSEGSGVALAEAMACGCVPIVSNIPSFEYMTENGAVGKLFNKGNPMHLAQKLTELTGINIESERKKTREIFVGKLSFQAIGKKTSEVIHHLYADL
ncbi:glycosyltransferase family 4 protein [Flavobacterium sp.]|uniref:glycosyltransferase family 4 protein n=1 Tax=Flavobacterium sp. TaxID=239 RepID=UPI00286D1003|nr:glycosyltransferase family 4 protein [Flavobacterium sp.]